MVFNSSGVRWRARSNLESMNGRCAWDVFSVCLTLTHQWETKSTLRHHWWLTFSASSKVLFDATPTRYYIYQVRVLRLCVSHSYSIVACAAWQYDDARHVCMVQILQSEEKSERQNCALTHRDCPSFCTVIKYELTHLMAVSVCVSYAWLERSVPCWMF